MVFATLMLTGCDELVSYFVTPDNLDIVSQHLPKDDLEVMRVHKLEFSPDYKTFSVTTRMYGDIGPYALTDTAKLRIDVESSSHRATPRLISMKNVKMENFTKKEVEMLALVDLTQPQEVLDRIHAYIMELHGVFNDSNLHVSFIYPDSITSMKHATEYTLNKYLVQQEAPHILLYQAIAKSYKRMVAHEGCLTNAKRMALLVFSDSEVYDEQTDQPIDPNHYDYEESLAQLSMAPARNMVVCYADMRAAEKKQEQQELLIVKHLCEETKGVFMSSYNGTEYKNALLNAFHISPDANIFVFENPDGKVYCGNFEKLNVRFHSIKADTLVTQFSTTINKGNFYNPIIVNGRPVSVVIMIGILLSIFIIFIVWVLLQYAVPFISYQWFRHKYVIRYAGRNMGIGRTLVAETCYLCKEPFQTGDEVVVKCSHTMHKSCWDENGYHCTEYSDRCQHGSHYYNTRDLSDRQNAPYYMKWILSSIIATTLAWIMFISRSHRVTAFMVERLACWIEGVTPGSPEAAALLTATDISPLPSFGFSVGLFMTAAIAVLSTQLLNVRHNFLEYVVRSILAACLCYVAFLIINVIVIVAELQEYAFLLEWVPWVLTAFIIAFCGTYGTRVRLRKMLIVPSVAVAIVSMYVWWMFYNNAAGYRLTLLIGYIFFGAGLAACIATVAPRSERYFLHVEGAIKPMDIAIFKWFRNAPDRVVSIGKSLDCSLQLSWDISGNVAPVHAEIRLRHRAPYLTALEEGIVANGHRLKVGREIWLHHGSTFTIGNTQFTYIEKDIR